MGIYLNPNGEAFEMAVQSAIYVDKTEMLSYLNSVLGKEQRFVCVSRPRRFGKSIAANMVSAYYSRASDAEKIFKGLAIAQSESFQHYAGKYDVIHLNIFPAQGVQEVYNPRSVVSVMENGTFDNYWNRTETFEALKIYIDLNFDGLREAVIALMAGERHHINTKNFANDMSTFQDKDDVLTLLIHLGYLGYDFSTSSVFIPNQEILSEYASSVRSGDWSCVAKAVKASEELLACTLDMEEEKVARSIEAAHLETSHLTYNDENALAYTISLAYYTARRKYLVVREFPTGKGFADLVYLPRPTHPELPAMIIKLKWNKSTRAAIDQIKERQYVHALTGYKGRILLVGISYDKSTKKHSCKIEEWEQ